MCLHSVVVQRLCPSLVLAMLRVQYCMFLCVLMCFCVCFYVFAHFLAFLQGFARFRVFLDVFVLSGRSWALVGHSWAFLGRSWTLLEGSWTLLGRYEKIDKNISLGMGFGRVLGRFGRVWRV